MIDLPALGQELRNRRRSLRVPSAELARRIGVSPTYVWLIEQARPRSSGEPSRPGEALLERWMAALGFDDAEARDLRQLAGYFDPEEIIDRRGAAADEAVLSVGLSPTRFEATPSSVPAPRASSPMFNAPSDALRSWAQRGQPADSAEKVHHRLDQTLDAADRAGRRDEAAILIDSFLRWLAAHVGEEQ